MKNLDDLGMPKRQMHLSVGDDGLLNFSFFGDSSSGEENVQEVAELVVLVLNESGEEWSRPTLTSSDADECDAVAHGPTGELRMQISRVPHSSDFWRAVREEGGLSSEATPSELASQLIEAIRAKAAKYPSEVKARTTLVLDGLRSFVYDSPPVVRQFAAQHLDEARTAGFADILLQGSVRLVPLLNPPLDDVWWRAP